MSLRKNVEEFNSNIIIANNNEMSTIFRTVFERIYKFQFTKFSQVSHERIATINPS